MTPVIKENAECTLYPGLKKAYLFETTPPISLNTRKLTKVAEAGTLYGTYFVTPPAGANYKQMEVEVTVYSGDSKPSTLLYTETFQPTYSNKSILDDTFIETAKSLNRSQESYIHFSKPINVSGKFYIGYKLKSVPENTYFSAYNLPKGKTTRNTAWVHDKNGWRQATEYTQAGLAPPCLSIPSFNTVTPSATKARGERAGTHSSRSGERHGTPCFAGWNGESDLYAALGTRKSVGKRRDHGQASYTPFPKINIWSLLSNRALWRGHYTQKIIF